MSFQVQVTGAEPFSIEPECTKHVKFSTDIPMDSDARTKDVSATLVISGKILANATGAAADSTRQMLLWSVVPAERAEAYRNVTVTYVAGGVVERKYTFTNAFVVDYQEVYDDGDGNGTFTLWLKQKKDKMAELQVEGGYSA